MTDIELATLSTVASLILTSALFVALARWSAGNGSWTILPGVVRGVRDWMARDEPPRTSSSSSAAVSLTLPHAWQQRADPRGEELAQTEDLGTRPT